MTDRVRSREALVDTLAQTDPRETIRPREVASPERKRPDGTVQLIGGDVDHVQVDERGLASLAPRLVLGTTIGEGGMAIVRTATQTALGREVAVKTARPENAAKAAPGLLREAWITGALEHPNIVPIHDLGADDAGRPILVLKRIEGRPWSALLDQPLDWHLRQLEQVCHGVAFAHSRGIVHRDLKPANVMIGAFGEVYVLDWGIAVSLVDDGTGRLPLASGSREVAGTLAYMAPEMLEGVATEQTDVYLLGSILFELITGAPPHASASIDEALASIALSQPAVPDDAPTELVSICRRAMAATPADRFASVEALRSAIVEFREHRDSSEIARAALERLAELEAKLAAPSPERAVTYQLYGEI
ncbi:MAG TPA: serine/threonine-protein kinase, partial [Kofleriaceae bacterium]